MELNPAGDIPEIDSSSFAHPSAILIGRIKIGRNVFIGPQAVIRADEPGSHIVIGDDCNIQDRVVVHSLKNSAVIIGERVSLSHGCIVHGPCRISDGCFIGFGSVVFDSDLGRDVFIKSLAVISGADVASGRLVPDGAVINTAKRSAILKKRPKETIDFAEQIVITNKNLLRGYCRIKQHVFSLPEL